MMGELTPTQAYLEKSQEEIQLSLVGTLLEEGAACLEHTAD